MSRLMDERRWRELKKMAADEADPFRLVRILAEIAALARKEQEQVKRRLKPAIQNYYDHQQDKKQDQAVAFVADASAQLEIVRYATLPEHDLTVEREPGFKAERFLRLADSVLRTTEADQELGKAA